MSKEYTIYHIPGKKIGVTNDLYNRVECQQGYEVGEYEILDSSTDIDYISKRELELQKEYGYRVDMKPYSQLFNNNKFNNNMKINVTEQTTTFPCPLNKLKGQLMDNQEMSWETEHGSVTLDNDLTKWIIKNAVTSMYNKAMAKYLNNRTNETVEHEYVPMFDMIREWAEQRGIYESGDAKTQYVKLMEEAGEVGRAILKDNDDDIMDGIGDMVVVLTNLAELCGTTIEECTERAYAEIVNRQGKMINGTFVKNN
jgi:NTP pyrophosphatase (non-canonical NTP hydrolase)